ncbi:hypothetical protein POM88_001555 [Heracleum sosnowskyi]|uniref:Uncharacterized protein n=1 Tax=Heracleum sosnowskyi TaxID=360622 RepID=A0AAD8JGC8_9APIA|nr:hypothetical protein POM88_001555 [Heracleum sosnowskyi]
MKYMSIIANPFRDQTHRGQENIMEERNISKEKFLTRAMTGKLNCQEEGNKDNVRTSSIPGGLTESIKVGWLSNVIAAVRQVLEAYILLVAKEEKLYRPWEWHLKFPTV